MQKNKLKKTTGRHLGRVVWPIFDKWFSLLDCSGRILSFYSLGENVLILMVIAHTVTNLGDIEASDV